MLRFIIALSLRHRRFDCLACYSDLSRSWFGWRLVGLDVVWGFGEVETRRGLVQLIRLAWCAACERSVAWLMAVVLEVVQDASEGALLRRLDLEVGVERHVLVHETQLRYIVLCLASSSFKQLAFVHILSFLRLGIIR